MTRLHPLYAPLPAALFYCIGCYPYPIEVRSFSVPASLQAPATAALERLHEATGAALELDPAGGLPVRWAALPAPQGGRTYRERFPGGPRIATRIDVATAYASDPDVLEDIVLHEIMHALAPDAGHTADGGAFDAVSYTRGRITAAGLLRVCTELECAYMRPEPLIIHVRMRSILSTGFTCADVL